MGAAADVQALAQELDIERGLLYGWRRIYIRGGAEALRNSGRPRVVQMHPSEASAASKVGPVWAAIPISTASAEETPGCPAMVPPASASCAAHDAVAAARRIADLERKIGQQQLELDFFRVALRHVRELRR
jgi:hypothetical protein